MELGVLRARIRDRRQQGPAAAGPAPRAHIQLRLRLPALWLILLLAAAVLLPDRVWNTLLIGLGGLFAAAFLWARKLAHGLEASRRLSFSWVSVGDRLQEQFTLTNESPVPALWVEVTDHSNVPGYRAAVVRSVGGRGQDRWRQSAVCRRRGRYTLGPWTIRSSDPFGIFQITHHYPVSDEIIIHPPVHGQLPIPLPAGRRSGRMRVRRRSWLATNNAASVREYQPEDAHHLIHWPISAHRDSLYVRQFDLDAAGDIWLLLDLEQGVQLGQGEEGTEEHAVLLAAALSARALRENRAVGLAAYGRRPQVLVPNRGRGQQWRILRALALVNADGETSLSRALQDLGQTARRGTTAVIITPSLEPGWLPQLLALTKQGVRSSVILLDRPSFGGEGASQGLAETIRQQGFTSYVVRQGEVGQPLEQQARRGYWEFRVTGTGKVVIVETPWDERGASLERKVGSTG